MSEITLKIDLNQSIDIDLLSGEVSIYIPESYEGLHSDYQVSKTKLSELIREQIELMDLEGRHLYAEKHEYDLEELKKSRHLLTLLINHVEEMEE